MNETTYIAYNQRLNRFYLDAESVSEEWAS